ncbi:MAG: LysM domain-containing protein [Nitriliruptoraceae bacterium]
MPYFLVWDYLPHTGMVAMRWWRAAGAVLVAAGLIGGASMFARAADPYGSLVTAVFVLALLTGAYLLVIVLLTVLTATFRSHVLPRLLSRFAPGRLSRLIAGALLLSGVSPTAANSAIEPQSNLSLFPLELATGLDDDVQALIDRLGWSSQGPTDEMLYAVSSYTVVTGDSFWRIAERHVQAAAEQAVSVVTVRTVATYWLALIEANLDVLVEAGNPNLLHVGQVLELPPFEGNGLS